MGVASSVLKAATAATPASTPKPVGTKKPLNLRKSFKYNIARSGQPENIVEFEPGVSLISYAPEWQFPAFENFVEDEQVTNHNSEDLLLDGFNFGRSYSKHVYV